MDELTTYLQLGANTFALAVAGWIYLAYVKNLRAVVAAKDEQQKVLEKNLNFWREKAREFEKKTPEYIEEVLSKRIKLREEEIARLDKDREENSRVVSSKTKEVARLREELEKAAYLGRALTLYDPNSDEEVVIPEPELELEYLGEVCVDSASLMITDPSYLHSEWLRDVEYEDLRLYRHADTGRVLRFGVDFRHYDQKIAELGQTPNDLIKSGQLIRLEIEREYSYSLPGALYASSSKEGYGVLKFGSGAEGAGICVRTVYGDGTYPVYGERYKGAIFRIYIELQ